MNAQNQIQTFQFQLNQSVRVEMKDGEPYFSLSDVAEILEIPRTSDLLQVRKDVVKNDTHTKRGSLNPNGVEKISVSTAGGKQVLTFINEPNLYRVIFRSNKQEAVKFQDWIFEKVIPQIRKTGSYQIPTKAIAPKKSKTVAGGLTLEQVEQVQAMHKMLVGSVEKTRQGALAVTLWSAIKAKFGCNYKEIPPEYFLDVLSLMSRTAAAKNAQWQQTDAPELKFNDCGIGKALFNLGRGELSGGDVETALYDMAQIQSAIAWMNYAAYSECTATDSQLENLNYASNALNNLSAMLMEAAAKTLKH